MSRVWVAVVLGVLIGLGIAASPTSIGTQAKGMLQPAELSQPARLEATSQAADPLQNVLLGLLAGIIVATPVFVLSRRRFR